MQDATPITTPQTEEEAADSDTVVIIAPHEAQQRLREAIREHLGVDWDDEDTGWMVIHNNDYLMRLTNGKVNLDFQCDLLGEVSVEERPMNPLQGSGRLIAWMVLGASLLIALVLARIAGVL